MVSAMFVPSITVTINVTDGITLTGTMAIHSAGTSTYRIVCGDIISTIVKLRDL
jgi:hypothetical protein